MRALPQLLFAAVLLTACGDDPPPAPHEERPTENTASASPPRAVPAEPPADAASTAPIPVDLSADAGPPLVASPLPPGKPLLLDFTRDHCLPCVLMEPWIGALREKHAAKVGVLEINIDRPPNKPLGLFFKIKSIPTQVYVDAQGREVHRNVGLARQPEMEALLNKLGFLADAPAR